MAALYVQLSADNTVTIVDTYWHAWQTATTAGYGDVITRLGDAPAVRLYTALHILISVFGLAAMVADLQVSAHLLTSPLLLAYLLVAISSFNVCGCVCVCTCV